MALDKLLDKEEIDKAWKSFYNERNGGTGVRESWAYVLSMGKNFLFNVKNGQKLRDVVNLQAIVN